MREIKFRGSRIDRREWVHGYIVKVASPCGLGWVMHIPAKDPDDNHRVVQVDPATVGQYTGLKDKNGTEIYEGDICNCREYECFGKIEWNEDNAGFYFYVVVEGGGFDEERLYEYADELEVIGNVHDNPELLGGAG